MPLTDAFEQVAAQAAQLSAKLARTMVKATRNILEIMVLSSLFGRVHPPNDEANLRQTVLREHGMLTE
jgi:hypothetical protein